MTPASSQSGECLDENAIWAFLNRSLPPRRAEDVRGHLDVCASCRTLVANVAQSLPPSAASDDSTVLDPGLADAKIHPGALAGGGQIIDGKYRVGRCIGKGGMGYVVEAVHLSLGTPVAIKLLHPWVVGMAEARARFLREARAAARIKSAHVVRVFDVGSLPDGGPFIVMELLQGNDLASELRRRGPLPVDEAVGYVLQACHALARAHEMGIVHRDLKPANLFLADEGVSRSLKVLDFGISKQTFSGTDAEFSTQGPAWLGTPRYMAPEQIKLGHPVDDRTDVWSLGVVLYELLSRELPFSGTSVQEHCRAALESEPRGLREARADVPAGLAAAVERCMAKEPGARFQSVAELASALAPFATGIPEALLRDIGQGVQTPVPALPRRGVTERGKRVRFAAVAAAVALTLVTAISVSVWRSNVARARPASAETAPAPVQPSTGATEQASASPAPEASSVPDVEPAPPAVSSVAAPAPTAASPRPVHVHYAPRVRNPEFGARR